MGGGGGSGGFSSSEAEAVQKAAEARLRAIASKSTKILFVCEAQDKQSLESRLRETKIFTNDRTIVVDGGQASGVDAALENANFLVAYTDETKSASFIDKVIDAALARKIAGVHVKANSKSLVPSKVSAYRWRSLAWTELEAIFGP